MEIARTMARTSAVGGGERTKPEENQQSQTSDKDLFGNNSDSSDLEEGLFADSTGDVSDSGNCNGASAQRTPVKVSAPKRTRPTEPEPPTASSPKIAKKDPVSANPRPQPVSTTAGKTTPAPTPAAALVTKARKNSSGSSGSSSSSESDSDQEDKKPKAQIMRPMGLKALKKPQPEESSD